MTLASCGRAYGAENRPTFLAAVVRPMTRDGDREALACVPRPAVERAREEDTPGALVWRGASTRQTGGTRTRRHARSPVPFYYKRLRCAQQRRPPNLQHKGEWETRTREQRRQRTICRLFCRKNLRYFCSLLGQRAHYV